MKYRPDIDGLRAIAVLAVVLFHADFALFGGGFIGVDVFFVISGYLITSLIVKEMDEDRFSLIGFYERRARRILPALFVVLLVSFAVAPFALSPDHFADFRDSVVAATLFFSNILFWQESGYFDAPANFKPLLHTWSLAVEEQFYIFFPPFLLLVTRFAGRRWRTLIVSVALISFALSTWGVVYNPAGAFYLPQTRVWELLLGSVLALRLIPPIVNGPLRNIASAGGLALIAWGVFTFDNATPFPGANAAFPCLGAAILIHAGGPDSTIVNRLLSTRVPVFIGLISYSLYLWHWPAFVFTRSFIPRDLTAIEIFAVIGFSFVAAILSWRFVEQPFRGGGALWSRNALFSGAGGVAAIFIAIAIVGTSGDSVRRSGGEAAALSEPGFKFHNYRACFLETGQSFGAWQADDCFINHGGAANALLWGDSFAAHYVPGLQSNRDAWSHNILQYTAAQCAPVFGWDPFISPNCAEFNDHVLDVVEKFQIETVIVAADWNAAFGQGLPPGGITATVRSLSALGLKVIVIGQSPVFRPNIEWLAARGLFDDGAPIEFDKDINTRILQQSSGAVFIDPLPFLCDDTTCRYRTAENSHFSDSVHLSVFGSEWLVAQFLPLLRGVL